MSYIQLGDFHVIPDSGTGQPHGYVFGEGFGVGSFGSKLKKKLKKAVHKVLSPVRRLIGAASEEEVQNREEKTDPNTSQYVWVGGEEGQVDQYGIPYGTPMAEAQVMLARASAAHPELAPSAIVAAPTAQVLDAAGLAPVAATETPFESILPGGSSTMLGIPTLYVLAGAAVGVLGIGYMMKRRK